MEKNGPPAQQEHDVGAPPPLESSPPVSNEAPRSALQATLTVASTAANLVLFPYVVAGRAAYQATSFAVTAPIKVTKHVANSITESWHQQLPKEADAAADLFGERELTAATTMPTPAQVGTNGAADTDLFGERQLSSDEETPLVEGVLFETEAPADDEPQSTYVVAAQTAVSSDQAAASSGMVSRLIFLPVRLVSSGVSTAAALPASAISFTGRTISGAVSSSQSIASSALVASGGLALRTSRHVATGITQGAFSTAHRVGGLVGSSVRTVSYVIPPSVSNALWHGMERTGSMSTSAISYAIAVPVYRMTQALVPEVGELFTEQQCVDTTRDGVKMLVKVLGPQNAFYVLKYMYETVNSEEVYDVFLLCQDLVRESLDSENYKTAGSSVSKATGIDTLTPVVKEIFHMMPSLDELVDVALFVGDITEEILTQVAEVSAREEGIADSGRFEYLSSEEEDQDDAYSNDISGMPVQSGPVFAQESFEMGSFTGETEDEPLVIGDFGDGFGEVPDAACDPIVAAPERLVETFDDAFGASFGLGGDSASSSSNNDDSLADLFNSSVTFFSSVLDSNEASVLFNAVGDFIDVLVD